MALNISRVINGINEVKEIQGVASNIGATLGKSIGIVSTFLTGGKLGSMVANIKTRGISKPTRYEVELTFPMKVLEAARGSGLSVNNSFIMKGINLRAEAAELPSRTVVSEDLMTVGAMRKIPYYSIFEPLNLTFMLSEDILEKKLFDIWAAIPSRSTDGSTPYYNDYAAQSIAVKKLNDVDQVVETYTFFECYPTQVGRVQLGYELVNQHSRLPVTFNFHRWESKSTSKIDKPALISVNSKEIGDRQSIENGAGESNVTAA